MVFRGIKKKRVITEEYVEPTKYLMYDSGNCVYIIPEDAFVGLNTESLDPAEELKMLAIIPNASVLTVGKGTREVLKSRFF